MARIQESLGPTVDSAGSWSLFKSDFKKLIGRAERPPALWADRAKTETMLFSDAHATPYEYAVHIGEEKLKLGVNGGTFGRIKSVNPHIQQAYRNHPSSFLVQMSCKPAGGPAAEASARTLQEAGINIPVYAARSTVVTAEDTLLGIYRDLAILAPPGTPTGSEHHWVEYKPRPKTENPPGE
ncbi:hypothetical protein ABZV91_30655 [Nocardia sp. NPDC004568]|uniref:hypothetical protein n=1 Tax=Nocardia sp. NPDC004568 TaxID=3154551 RepID=UPI0033BD2B73